jgi:hypothetical protein
MMTVNTQQIDPAELVSNAGTAALLQVKPQTLATWRCHKRGPTYFKVGRAVFYRRSDVAEWLAAQRHTPAAA